MSGTGCAEVSIETFTTVGSLPPAALSLLDAAGSIFAGCAWWEVVLAEAMPQGAGATLIVCRVDERVVAVVPMLRRRGGGLQSLTTPYSCSYTPILAPDLGSSARIAVMSAFARFCRPGGVIRLDALPVEWGGLPDLMTAVRAAGLRPLRFDHFGNWYEEVAGQDFAFYLGRRPGPLREIIRRRLRWASRQSTSRFALLTAPAEMDAATEAFETVHGHSWKDPEPFPQLQRGADAGHVEPRSAALRDLVA